MGLAGRKAKQRIGSDPRNLTWADDAAKFGQQYLAKLGWDPSRGLGVSGDGRTSHIKVAQKLNLLGIGAAGMGDETVAWKQNRDYEMLLKRLNEGSEAGQEEEGETEKEKGEEEGVQNADMPKKKRKRDDDAIVDADEEEERKKQKKEKKNRKEQKKKMKDDEEKVKRKSKNEQRAKEEDKDKEEHIKPEPTESSLTTPVIQAPTPRPMAHRARFLRSKQLASRDSSAVAEILGISTSTSNSPGPPSLSATPFLASSESQTPVPETNQDLRTSSTSVGDYFKEKLAARALGRSKSSTPRPSALSAASSIPGPDSTLVRESVANVSGSADDYETPPAGLGSRTVQRLCSAVNGGETPRAGFGVKFGSLMGAFTSSEVISIAHDDLPKNEEPVPLSLPEATEGTRGDERASGGKKKGKKAENAKEEKKGKEKKKRIKSISDVANDAAPRAAESVTATETDRLIGDIRKEEAGRKEKKKRKEKKGKRQVDAC